jgi:hypothetical protein
MMAQNNDEGTGPVDNIKSTESIGFVIQYKDGVQQKGAL